MKKNISFFKKLSLFRQFRKTIKDSETDLEQRFNLRLDKAGRLYTVLNIPQDLVGEAYSLKKSDIDRISDNFIKQYSNEVALYLNSKGLNELYAFYKADKIDKYSYLLVFGFSLFRSDKFYDVIYYRIIPALIIIIASLFFIF